MKSIKEIAKFFNSDPLKVNNLFVNHGINIDVKFGINDGFISNYIWEHIERELANIKENYPTRDDILENKKEWVSVNHRKAYVYFLILDNTIVYVGQSVSLMSRIAEHIKTKKEFNYIYYVEVPKRLLSRIENYYIREIRPYYNIAGMDSLSFLDSIVSTI